jgi:hypothetical protein
MNAVESKSKRYNPNDIFWRVFLVAGFLSFLIYGLSFFASSPTVETITTRPAKFDSNDQPMRDVKFQSNGNGR